MRRGKGAKTEEGGAAPAQPAQPAEVNPYENSIKPMCTVQTVEEFWSVYNYLRRPNDLPTTTDYHFFRDGVKPTWEDQANARGGKWIIRLPKGLASRYWEEVILALIGGQFPGIADGEICGMVVSIRYSEDILGIWNKTSTDREVVDRLRDAIKRVLQLPSHANMEYKPHQTSIQDKSSFRNTQVWKPKSLESRTEGTGRTEPSTGSSTAIRETRRTGSWGERETKPAGGPRQSDRAWR
jgi:translation initiation factor 4E